jgi:hypothetical protein
MLQFFFSLLNRASVVGISVVLSFQPFWMIWPTSPHDLTHWTACCDEEEAFFCFFGDFGILLKITIYDWWLFSDESGKKGTMAGVHDIESLNTLGTAVLNASGGLVKVMMMLYFNTDKM